jgi:acyl-CoA synthetase (AMP-forming)/AMP-acid ligase II
VSLPAYSEVQSNVSSFVLTDDVDAATACVTCEDVTLSRGEVRERAQRFRDLLESHGICAGDLVVVNLPNGLDVVSVILGAWSAGAAVAPVNAALGAKDRDKALHALEPAFVVTTADTAEAIASVKPEAVVLAAGSWTTHGAPRRRPDSRTAGMGTALVLHTSGTSGAPKAVLLSHDALTGALESVLRMLGSRAARGGGGAPNLVVFPLAHVAGLYNVLLAFRNGREVILMPRFAVEPFVRIVKERKIRSVVLNPTMIQMLLEAAVPAEDLADLRFVRSGSAPLPVSVAKRFLAAYGITVLNAYGQTETAGEVIGWNAADLKEFGESKVGSVGRPHPGISVRFVDENLGAVAAGDVGEMCVQTPFGMTGYLAGTSEDKYLEDGFLRTGDLGFADADGFIWLVGRRSDVIVCGGFKILPEEVEEVLRDHPAVADVMVAGLPDERLGEAPHAFVVLAEDPAHPAEGLDRELIEHVRAQLSHYKAPRAVHFVPVLPRNASGKVMRAGAEHLIASAVTAPGNGDA